MRRKFLGPVVLVVTLVSALAETGVASASAMVGEATSTPHVLTCRGKSVYEPKSIVIYCADANASLIDLHWTSWKSKTAKATGMYAVNDCKPTCAAGKFHNYPGTGTLLDPKSTKNGLLFTLLTVVYVQNKKSCTFNEPLPTKKL